MATPTTSLPAAQFNFAYNIVMTFAGISIAFTTVAMLVTFIFRDRASFVFSQPSFLGVLLLGILLLQMSQFFLAVSLKDALIYSGSSASCRTYLWLFWVGSSLALAAQCARLYRALLVFRERSLRRPKLNTTKFFLSMGVLFMIPMGLMMVRMFTDPVQINQGVCLPLEVATNPNSVVVGLMVRLAAWGLLIVCFWFTRILQKLGATVDDAKTMTKLFLWIFIVDAFLTGIESQGLPSDHVAILLSGAIAFGTITTLHAVFSLKLQRVGLNGKEMLIALRREKETREINAMALKMRPIIGWPAFTRRCCKTGRKEPLMLAAANPQAEIAVSSRAPRVSLQGTHIDGEELLDEGYNEGFISDVILASMNSRPVSRISYNAGGSLSAQQGGSRFSQRAANNVAPNPAGTATVVNSVANTNNNNTLHTSIPEQHALHPLSAAVPPQSAGEPPGNSRSGRVVLEPILSHGERTSSNVANDVILASMN